MAKKKEKAVEDAEIVNEAQAVDESLVTVQMTPEQQDEFVAFMAEKERKESEQKEAREPIAVQLTYRHNINGVKFGPGVVQVPRELLGALQEQEFKQRDLEMSRFQDKGRTFQVLQSGQVVASPAANAKKAGF